MRIAPQSPAPPRVPFVQELATAGVNLLDVYRRYGLEVKEGTREQPLLCPFHEDRSPSLSFNAEKALWRCHACDIGGDAVDFVARRLSLPHGDAIRQMRRDLGLERGAEGPSVSAVAPKDPAGVEAIYTYTDATGEVVYEVVRLPGKQFRLRQPSGEWSVNGVRRVLYRLPQLLAAPVDEIVFLTEGEKDSDSLAALGLVATTNSNGAANWQNEFAEPLRGRSVVILEDNDQAGRERTATILGSLLPPKGERVAASVRVVGFPELPEKADVSDWIGRERGAGRTEAQVRAALLERVASASVCEPVLPKRASQTLAVWLATPAPELVWLIDELFPENGIVALVAKPKQGKTFIAIQAALSLASGTDFLGFETTRSSVLYVDEETGRPVMRQRIEKMLLGVARFRDPETAANLHIATWHGFNLGDPEDLRDEIQATGAKVVILDSFRRVFGGDENDSREMRDAMAVLGQLRAELGCSFLILHHSRKNVEGADWADAARGSGDFQAALDGMVFLTRRADGVTTVRTQMRAAPPREPFSIAMNEETLLMEPKAEEDRPTPQLREILEEQPEGRMSLKEVQDLLRSRYGLSAKRISLVLSDPRLPEGVGKRRIEGGSRNAKELFLTHTLEGQLVPPSVIPGGKTEVTGPPSEIQLVPSPSLHREGTTDLTGSSGSPSLLPVPEPIPNPSLNVRALPSETPAIPSQDAETAARARAPEAWGLARVPDWDGDVGGHDDAETDPDNESPDSLADPSRPFQTAAEPVQGAL